jgi:hypothetical protein
MVNAHATPAHLLSFAWLAVELRQLSALRELNLEGNRIATPVLDLRMMHSTLQSLQASPGAEGPGGGGGGGGGEAGA